jgi:hypothetical protein
MKVGRNENKHTILIDRKLPLKKKGVDNAEVLDESALFQMIFWRCPRLAEPARKVFGEVKLAGSGLQDKTWRELCEKHSIKIGDYYHIRHALLTLGLIQKEGRLFLVSKTLLNKMTAVVEVIEQLTGIKSPLRNKAEEYDV